MEYLFDFMLMLWGFILGYIVRELQEKPIKPTPHEHYKNFKKHENVSIKWTIK